MSQRSDPAMGAVREFPDLEAEKDPVKSQPGAAEGMKVGMTLVGTILLLLVALTPIWDAWVLLNSSAYVYFIGRADCFRIICFCLGVILFYVLTMLLTTRLARPEKKTDQTFMYVFISTLTMLGLGLLLFSTPLRLKSNSAYNELMANSMTFGRTQPLYYELHEYYSVLLDLRLTPGCVNKISIEECAGYAPHYPETGFLKEMELSYECSGFFYSGTKALPATTQPPLPAVLVQQAQMTSQGQAEAANSRHMAARGAVKISPADALRHGPPLRLRKGKRQQGVSLIAGGLTSNLTAAEPVPTWVETPQGLGDTENDMIATGWMSEYPPNLFTNANYKTTCDGAAARELRFGAVETAELLYLEGAALLVIAVFAGFMKLCAMSMQGRRAQKEGT